MDADITSRIEAEVSIGGRTVGEYVSQGAELSASPIDMEADKRGLRERLEEFEMMHMSDEVIGYARMKSEFIDAAAIGPVYWALLRGPGIRATILFDAATGRWVVDDRPAFQGRTGSIRGHH